jgi:ABC-type multidrug transport system ATPase subunit
MTSLVSARNVSKSYGSVRVVDDVNFEVEKGCITGLIGPNGAGCPSSNEWNKYSI